MSVEAQEQRFECRICIPSSDETAIRLALQRALPSLRWEEGDSSWDKIRVWGTGPDADIRIYRYEEPGPFDLTITLKASEGADVGKAHLAFRDKVVAALDGKVWKPLEPQPVSLIRLHGEFPATYKFECDLSIRIIKEALDDADFWSWQALQKEPFGLCLEGRIPFRLGGKVDWKFNERIRIAGDRPSYRIEVGKWEDAPDRLPSCGQVHETVQNTILPAIGARNVRAAD